MNQTLLQRFMLGEHVVELTEDATGTLALSVDGCLRKRRGPSSAYLWTSVELPFEDHHLIEVRRQQGGPPKITVNGAPAPSIV